MSLAGEHPPPRAGSCTESGRRAARKLFAGAADRPHPLAEITADGTASYLYILFQPTRKLVVRKHFNRYLNLKYIPNYVVKYSYVYKI